MAKNIGNPRNIPGDMTSKTPIGGPEERRRDPLSDEAAIERDVERGPIEMEPARPVVGTPAETPVEEGGGTRGALEGMKESAREVAHEVKANVVGGSRSETFPTSSGLGSESMRNLTKESIDKLNEFLRGELSAVEAYDLALRSVRDPELSSALRQIRDNHDRRVTELRDLIRGCGGEPSQSSGAWGAFAKVVQAGADLFGERSAVSMLEEGEDHGMKMYREDIDTLASDLREFVIRRLLPEQQKTHDLCRSLEQFTKAA